MTYGAAQTPEQWRKLASAWWRYYRIDIPALQREIRERA